MKRFTLVLFIVLTTVLALAGCGSDNTPNADIGKAEIVQVDPTVADPNVDLDLVAVKEPYDTLLRTTDNVGKTVRVKLTVDKIREVEISGNKATVAYGNPDQGIGDRIAVVTLGPAWENISKGQTIEEVGLVAYVDGHDGHETPAMKLLPNESLQQMIVSISASRKALSFLPHAVVVVLPEEMPKAVSGQTI